MIYLTFLRTNYLRTSRPLLSDPHPAPGSCLILSSPRLWVITRDCLSKTSCQSWTCRNNAATVRVCARASACTCVSTGAQLSPVVRHEDEAGNMSKFYCKYKGTCAVTTESVCAPWPLWLSVDAALPLNWLVVSLCGRKSQLSTPVRTPPCPPGLREGSIMILCPDLVLQKTQTWSIAHPSAFNTQETVAASNKAPSACCCSWQFKILRLRLYMALW